MAIGRTNRVRCNDANSIENPLWNNNFGANTEPKYEVDINGFRGISVSQNERTAPRFSSIECKKFVKAGRPKRKGLAPQAQERGPVDDLLSDRNSGHRSCAVSCGAAGTARLATLAPK
jgi:hypothetical protein